MADYLAIFGTGTECGCGRATKSRSDHTGIVIAGRPATVITNLESRSLLTAGDGHSHGALIYRDRGADQSVLRGRNAVCGGSDRCR